MKFIGWIVPVCLLSLLTGGCGSNPAPGMTTPPTVGLTSTADEGALPAPNFNQASRLYMVSDSGEVIKIGDLEDAFKVAYPRSPSDSRSLKGQLPQEASGSQWQAIGWELDNASRGVGALLYQGRIALAMSQIDKVEEEDVIRESQKYELKLGPPTRLEGAHVRYWFWPDDAAILMVCAFKNDRNEINLTTALGDSGVMEKLRMSYQTAREDMGAVERLYNPNGGGRQVPGTTQ